MVSVQSVYEAVPCVCTVQTWKWSMDMELGVVQTTNVKGYRGLLQHRHSKQHPFQLRYELELVQGTNV